MLDIGGGNLKIKKPIFIKIFVVRLAIVLMIGSILFIFLAYVRRDTYRKWYWEDMNRPRSDGMSADIDYIRNINILYDFVYESDYGIGEYFGLKELSQDEKDKIFKF